MTNEEAQEIARLMGARIIAKFENIGHGAPAAALMARFHDLRMLELRREDEAHAAAAKSPAPSAQQPSAKEELAAAVREANEAAARLTSALARATQVLARLDSFPTTGHAPGSV